MSAVGQIESAATADRCGADRAEQSLPKRIAIVHEWLTGYAGSERVLEQMLRVFPGADLFAVVDFVPTGQRGFILDKEVNTSFIQRLPLARTRYRSYLPLMPLAIEQFDLADYDLVISSSHAVAKGVLTCPDQLHLCMCYTPIRYAWDLQHQYLQEANLEKGFKSWLARWILHRIRLWDVRTVHGVDEFIAISKFVARRIKKLYGREATVIYPPVDTDLFIPSDQKEEFYLTASRMVPYKKIGLIVDAFSAMPSKRLIVIGDGPECERVRARALDNITFLGYQPFESLRWHMQHARAFVFAANEDFGIIPLEAQACGTPVIALAKGATRETIRGLDSNFPSGVFFPEQTAAAIQEATRVFEANCDLITPAACRQNASRFQVARFHQEFSSFVSARWTRFQEGLRAT